MYRAFFRIGSERYAVQNRTFGIATLHKRHLTISGKNLIFQYVGKKQIHQRRVVADTPLVEIVEKLLELPGERLFRYRSPTGETKDVTASDVNAYLRRVLRERYTSKDIRTWGGTVRAATILADFGIAPSRREAEKNIVLACKLVSTELGNTPAICRSAYIHPAVLESYIAGETIERVMRKTPPPGRGECAGPAVSGGSGVDADARGRGVLTAGAEAAVRSDQEVIWIAGVPRRDEAIRVAPFDSEEEVPERGAPASRGQRPLRGLGNQAHAGRNDREVCGPRGCARRAKRNPLQRAGGGALAAPDASPTRWRYSSTHWDFSSQTSLFAISPMTGSRSASRIASFLRS